MTVCRRQPDASPARLPGYASGFVAIPRPFCGRGAPPAREFRASAPRAAENAEEDIVAPARGRYIGRVYPPAGPAASPQRRCRMAVPDGAATRCRPWGRCDICPRIFGKFLPAAPGRSAGRRRSYERAGVFADAMPIEEFRDVMVPNAPGRNTISAAISFYPHSTASPAGRSAAARAARLGVLPQCRSACLSMPPTPRKPA
jgi:hypothetical protein